MGYLVARLRHARVCHIKLLLIATISVYALSLSEREKPAIYLLLCAAVPTFGESIPGFAGITRFIEISPQLAIAFIVLAPALITPARMRKSVKSVNAADRFFLIWLLLEMALAVRAPSFTHLLRSALETFLSVAPIYYVFSRWPRSLDDIRIFSAAFILPVLILCAISIFELVRAWHLYTTISIHWFGPISFSYVERAGLLRASASVFNPIVWSFVAMSMTGLALAFVNDKFSGVYKWASFGLLGAGMLTSLSRGPWIGAVVIIVVFAITGPKRMSRLTQLAVMGTAAFFIALLTPFGDTLFSLIPFIGDADTGTISYRRQLLDAAWVVMLENPFFGSGDFLQNSELQHMRQGQGIIDIVNTYLQVGLRSGLIGLALFLGIFASVLLGLRGAMKSAIHYDQTLALYCRAWFATLAGIMVAIFTTSSVGQIPIIYWGVAAIGVALARIEKVERARAAIAPQEPPAAVNAQPDFGWK